MADYGRSGIGGVQELFSGHVKFEMSSAHLGGEAMQAIGHMAQVQL